MPGTGSGMQIHFNSDAHVSPSEFATFEVYYYRGYSTSQAFSAFSQCSWIAMNIEGTLNTCFAKSHAECTHNGHLTLRIQTWLIRDWLAVIGMTSQV